MVMNISIFLVNINFNLHRFILKIISTLITLLSNFRLHQNLNFEFTCYVPNLMIIK
jgi:hypothetical protein